MTTTHIIENGVAVNTIIATLPEAQAAFPNAICVDGATGAIGWTWDGTALQPPAGPPLADRREAGSAAIKAERDRRKFAGVKVGTDWFHADLESRSQWERMANKAYQLGLTGTDAYTIGGQSVPWKTMTGTFVALTAGKIFAVVDAIELQEALIFGCAQQHITAVQASATPESYDFSTGWPATFEAS